MQAVVVSRQGNGEINDLNISSLICVWISLSISFKSGGFKGFWALGQSVQFLRLLQVPLFRQVLLVPLIHLLLYRLVRLVPLPLYQGLVMVLELVVVEPIELPEVVEVEVVLGELAVAGLSLSRETTRLISTPSLLSICPVNLIRRTVPS